MRYDKKLAAAAGAAAALALVLASASPASAAKPPVGRTYFVISIGTERAEGAEYEMGAGCVSFTATEFCQEDECGSWSRTTTDVQTPKQTSFTFEVTVTDDETGLPVDVDGEGRIDLRGRKDALAGAASGLDSASGEKINFAFAGRSVGPARCTQLVEEFEAANP